MEVDGLDNENQHSELCVHWMHQFYLLFHSTMKSLVFRNGITNYASVTSRHDWLRAPQTYAMISLMVCFRLQRSRATGENSIHSMSIRHVHFVLGEVVAGVFPSTLDAPGCCLHM